MTLKKEVAAPTLRLKPSVRKKLKKLPRQEGRSLANYFEQLIKREVEREASKKIRKIRPAATSHKRRSPMR